MSNLDRQFRERSIDHNHKMERFKEQEFSGWDNFWIPLKLWVSIGGLVAFVGWIAWLLIRPFL